MERDEGDDYFDFGDEEPGLLVSPASPQEVLSDDYVDALASLKSFIETDQGQITNLTTLAGVVSHVGPNLKTVILANAKYWSDRSGEENREGGIMNLLGEGNFIRGTVEGHILFAEAGENYVCLVAHRGKKQGPNLLFQITFLLGAREGLDGMDNTPTIVDLRPGRRRFYMASWINKEEDFQVYLGVLKEGVQELLFVLPESSEIPPAFRY